jgi:hypothetical protein
VTADAPSRARHSDPTLLGLERLRDTMHGAATPDEREAWWSLVLRTQSSIEGDARAAKADREAMRRLRQGVSEVYGALNRGQEPDYPGAVRAIAGLQHLLETRTTGFDGHRLR